MRKYRRGKNRCLKCGMKLDDGNDHTHSATKIWADKLQEDTMKKSKFVFYKGQLMIRGYGLKED